MFRSIRSICVIVLFLVLISASLTEAWLTKIELREQYGQGTNQIRIQSTMITSYLIRFQFKFYILFNKFISWKGKWIIFQSIHHLMLEKVATVIVGVVKLKRAIMNSMHNTMTQWMGKRGEKIKMFHFAHLLSVYCSNIYH